MLKKKKKVLDSSSYELLQNWLDADQLVILEIEPLLQQLPA